jgi:hypothetical protein
VTVDRELFQQPIRICAIWDGMRPDEKWWANCSEYHELQDVAALRVVVPHLGNGKPFYVVSGSLPEFNVFVYDLNAGGKLIARSHHAYVGANVDAQPAVAP